jgi:hypothetical protein
VREALAAGPANVRLREKSAYWYEAGLRLSGLSHLEDARALPAAIQATLATRVALILSESLRAAGGADASAFLAPLTNLEQGLFFAGAAHARDKLAWMQRHTDAMRPGEHTAAAAAQLAADGAGARAAGSVADARSILGGSYKRKRAAL